MKTLNNKELYELHMQNQARLENARLEKEASIQKEQQLANKARYDSHLEDVKLANRFNKRVELGNKIKTELLEAALDTIFDMCFGNINCNNTDEDDAFDQTIISNFISDEGINDLLDRFESRTAFLSELTNIIREDSEDMEDDIDDDYDMDSYSVDPDEVEDFIDSIKGNEEIQDIADTIRYRVSRATEDFMQKNLSDKMDIKDIMYDAKEKIDNIRTGDEDSDEAIKQEYTLLAKNKVNSLAKRPHSIFEQMVINLSKSILKDEKLKNKFTLKSGKLDMDTIIKRVTSYYTFLELATSLKMVNNNEKYIEEAIAMI
jgi:hypothetical protein